MFQYKGITIKFLLLLLLLVLICMEYDFKLVSGEIRCLEKERASLLKFKEGLIDEYDILLSWGAEEEKKECCRWWGVQCSNTTSHVIGLLLSGPFVNNSYYGFGGNISSALLEFHHLNVLDLSGNFFGGFRIPEFIGSMKQLQHLYLNSSYFAGIIPPQLGNLTNLQTLDLSFNLNLRSDNLNWLSHLSFLTRLDLSSSYISDANWLHQVLKLPFLKELSLGGCEITDASFTTGLFINSSFTSLSVLDLSGNKLTSSIFDWLFNISTSLVKLDLRSNQLDGQIPDALENFIFLEHLDLSYNAFVGRSSKSLWNLSHLQTLLLHGNELGGPLEESFGNLSCKVVVSLETLDLGNNQFTHSIPDLSECSQLRELYLSRNKLKGPVHDSLGQLSKLEILDISFNLLGGTVSATHFMRLHSLKTLVLSFNSLNLDLNPDWVPPFQLEWIELARCNMGPSFPKWLQTQSNVGGLDISRANISDEVPKWLWNFSHLLNYLNISNNQINGTIPDLSLSSIENIDVSSNKFSGHIPLPHPSTQVFQLSQNMFSGTISSSICKSTSGLMRLLDLSNNQLRGTLPSCWENMADLIVLNLNNNSFSGEVPRAFGSLTNLLSLHLRGNNFIGELPSTLKNCTYLKLIDLGRNKLTGNIPSWFGGNYPEMTWLSLRQNRFYGDIPPEICYLSRIQLLDLSENNISGKIPKCFSNFTSLVGKNNTFPSIFYELFTNTFPNEYNEHALVQWKGQESEYKNILGLLKLIDLSSNGLVGDIPRAFSNLTGLISLNLSRNNLTGSIDQDIGQMKMLEILDLSRNHLSGGIPIGLAQLHFLNTLDLSNNYLWGKIPLSTQLQSFNASVYAGNTQLCGLPLPLCPRDGPISPISNPGEDIDTNNDKDVWFVLTSFIEGPWISVIFGFIVGFWGIVGSLILKKSWRNAYFSFWNDVGDWLYVNTTIFLRKYRRN